LGQGRLVKKERGQNRSNSRREGKEIQGSTVSCSNRRRGQSSSHAERKEATGSTTAKVGGNWEGLVVPATRYCISD